MIQTKQLIIEQKVTLSLYYEIWLAFMCTPIDLGVFGVGFLHNPKVIRSLADVASVRVASGGNINDVWLNIPFRKPVHRIRFSGYSDGEAGSNGTRLISEMIIPQYEMFLNSKKIDNLIDQLFDSLDLFKASCKVRASEFCDGESIVIIADDKGGYNPLDKLAGKNLLEQRYSVNQIIITYARIISEIVQKKQKIGAMIAISWISATSLLIKMAKITGFTLIGYVRRARFIVFVNLEEIFTSITSENFMHEAI